MWQGKLPLSDGEECISYPTVCQRNSAPFYIVSFYIKWVTIYYTIYVVSFYIKWVTTSWTHSIFHFIIYNNLV